MEDSAEDLDSDELDDYEMDSGYPNPQNQMQQIAHEEVKQAPKAKTGFLGGLFKSSAAPKKAAAPQMKAPAQQKMFQEKQAKPQALGDKKQSNIKKDQKSNMLM